jgi:protein involved in polysaccharide export with SLBB domain
MSQTEVQQRLGAAGYPSGMLDSYIAGSGSEATVAPTLDAETIRAIALLGVDAFPPEVTRVADSVVARLRADSARADSLARAATKRLQLFGFDVLRQPSTRFQPVSGPVDDSYPLGPGDQLVLFLTGGVEGTQVLDVTSQGFVVVSKVGQVYVNSLTLGQFKNLLYSKLSQVYSGISRSPDARTQFDVTVAKVRVQSIRVAGEVTRPGTYQVAATGGVLAAIYEAGGLSELGSFRTVEIRRGRALVGTVDLYEYLLKGIVGGEPRLESGDVVFVPTHGPRVKLAGEVVRPAIYELRATETLRDAVRIAGGLTPWAATESASVDRLLPPGQRPEPGYIRTVLTASLREVVDSSAAPTALFAEDSVTVYRVAGGRRASVAIDGNVYQPGGYQLDPGMRLWDLIRAARGLRTDTYGGRVQILRTQPDSTRRLLGFELDSTAPANNPPLQESDRVTLYGTTAFRPQRYITVFGAVQRPGTLAFADSMTLRDAILYAGGLREDAYLGEAEISRLREQPAINGDSLAVILRVQLDSSYVVDSTGYVRRPVGRSDTPDVVLSPYDNVFVRHQPGWELQRNIAIGGEVRFPGRYTLTAKDERLSSVLARAGGLSPNAYARGMQMYRRTVDGAGRIAVDLPRVLRDPRHKDNVILAAGDSVYIPPFIPTVRVDGAVNFPTSVTYLPGAGLSYYIGAAGGYGPQADKKRAFVRQPNGLIERGGRPEPGANVSVPRRDPNERRTLIELVPFFTAAVQVVTAGATLIIALGSRGP